MNKILLAPMAALLLVAGAASAEAHRGLMLDPNPSSYHIPAPPQVRLHDSSLLAQQATIVVNYLPAGTNPHNPSDTCVAWTAAAQAAFSYAANIWATQLQSSVPITIDACFASSLGQGVLGQAGPLAAYRNFAGAPLANTWYPVALANALSGTDINGATAEIQAEFSSTFPWYFGTDGNTPPTQVDFVSVVLHELGHGLGFVGSADVSGGLGSWGDIIGGVNSAWRYDDFAQDLAGQALITAYANVNSAALAAVLQSSVFFSGANANAANGAQRVPLYAPSSWQPGSSYSHLDESFNNTPNALMTYSLRNGESIHSPGPVMLAMFKDMGWQLQTVAPPALVVRYRLYSPTTLEHLYTTDLNEYNTLPVCCAWKAEGAIYKVFNGAGSVGSVTAVPYYRLYNPSSFQHHWTTDANEYAVLATIGWKQEGVDGYIFPTQATGSVPLYRLYIGVAGGLHLWTTDVNEKNVLSTTQGWTFEGIAGYVMPLP